jgi:hypothetical protein
VNQFFKSATIFLSNIIFTSPLLIVKYPGSGENDSGSYVTTPQENTALNRDKNDRNINSAGLISLNISGCFSVMARRFIGAILPPSDQERS